MVFCLASAGNLFGQTIPLAGEWQMRVDAEGVGIKEKYFNDQFSGETGQLPGTHQDNLKGNNYSRKELGRFTHLSSFRGCIWYQKSVEIEDISKEYTLFMKRCGWESNVWINGKYVGTQNSLVAPHEYTLTSYLCEGNNTITLMFDNANRKGIGLVPDENEMILHYHLTQDVKKEAKLNCGGHQFKVHNWNGALGAVELLVREKLSIVKADVFSDIRASKVDVRVLIKNSSKAARNIRLSANVDGINKTVDHKLSGALEETLTFAMPISNPQLWSEYNPFLYTLKLQLGSQQHQVNFGMREISTEGVEMKLNGQRIFLRGTLECFNYPIHGHEPMDVAYWRKQISTAKQYGLNFFRFHSCCPPQAAFQAADELGFYMQVEVPGTSCPSKENEEDEATTQFLLDELKRIIYYFGNHPSFLLASMGNEQLIAGGQPEFIKRHKERLHIKVRYGQQTDPRHLYSAATHPWTEDREDDYFTSAWGTNRDKLCGAKWGGGVVKGYAPFNAKGTRFGTRYNYSDALVGLDRPLMTHESGQWCVYPDFREISRYHGATRFYNYEHFRKDLSDKGLLDYAADFTRASGKLALLLYKEEIEAVLRTPELSGIQLLQLQDYPGQGTSPIGIINSVWESKGLTTPEKFRQFCSDFVPLARMEKMVWESSETFGAEIELSNYSTQDFSGEITWLLQEDGGRIFAQGKLSDVLAPTGKLSKAGKVSVPLSSVAEAKSLRFVIETSNGKVNGYDLWFYPTDNLAEVPETVNMIHVWDEKAEKLLEKGAKVIFAPKAKEIKNSIPGTFSSVFWNSRMKRKQISKTMGLLIEPAHPALNDFPTQFHSNWQWQDIVNRSFSVDISSLSPAIRPAVRTIDTFFENKSLAMIFEFKYKNGSVLVCTADIVDDLAKRPEARQLRKSLMVYASSPLFNPDAPVTPHDFQEFLGRAISPGGCQNAFRSED